MPDSPEPTLDSEAATLPLSGPRPTLSAGNNIDLPLPEELTKLLPPGAYEVTRFLGAGGMGAVYQGMQVRLKRPVAIKIMRRDMGRDQDFEARFEREAQAMAKLNHPNIVSVIDYGEAGADYLYIVMELIDGADMMDVIRGGQMTQEMALSLLPQICDALQFAHDHGIVHRDIKPSNIMLTRDGRIKMADFGLAKHFDAESSFRTQTGTGMGTPDYAAPEQFSPNSPIDHRADIYALGVMIYQMITGQLPRGVWKPPSQRAEVAPQWDAIVSRAMQSDPIDRYQQASEVKTAVSTIPLSGKDGSAGTLVSPASSGVTAAKNDEADKSVRAPVKFRAPLFIGLITGAVVIAVGAFFALRDGDKGRAAGPPAAANGPGLTTAEKAPATPKAALAGASALPIAATALPESGWQPLFTATEWKAKPGFKNGQLNLSHARATKPQTWSDGAIRARIEYRDGSKSPSLVARQTQSSGGFYYRLGVGSDGKHIYLSHMDPKAEGNYDILGRGYFPAPLKLGDKLLLELRAQGGRLTGLLDGKVIIEALDTRLQAPGEWGIIADEGWFESVEVQPLPAAATPATIAATALPESEWKPLFTETEWRQEIPGKREFKNGVLHLAHSSIEKPWPAPDAGIRAAILIRGNSSEASRPNLKARSSEKGSYRLGLGADAKHLFLAHMPSGANPTADILAKHFLAKPVSTGDKLQLELRVMGDHIVGFLDGQQVIEAHDSRLNGPGMWGIVAEDAWFESVEVQPLPAATTAATILPESGWKPLIPAGDWRSDWSGESEYRGQKLKSSREYREGLLHIRNTGIPKPQPSPDGAIRTSVVVRDGSRNIAVAMRSKGTGRYQLGILGNSNSVVLAYVNPKEGETIVFGRHDFPKTLQAGDKVLLELRAEGDRLTGLFNGSVVIDTRDSRLKESGEWTAEATDGWFESVEVQPLPAASPSPSLPVSASWQNALADSAQLKFFNKAEITPDGFLLTGMSSGIMVYAGLERGDGGLRLRATADGLRQGLRARIDKQGSHYKLDIPNQTTLKLQRWDNVTRQSTLLREFPLPSGFNPLAEHEIELRAAGSALTVSLDRQTLGTVTDAVLKSGTFGVSVGEPITKPVLIKTLEFLDSGSAAISSSPNLPVSKSSTLTFNGHRYQLISTPSTWAEAKARAEAMGGHLATFTSEPEERWARETLIQPLSAQESASTKAPDQLYWIGGHAAAQSKDFRWLSGEPLGKIGWRSGNPGWRERIDMPETKAVGALFAAGLVVMRPHPSGEWISVQQQSLLRSGFIIEWDDAGGTSSVSPSPNLPISKSSDPKFPPGQWVKLFTKPEDLPADLRKPDSGVKWEDGWIRGLKVGQVLSLPNSLSGNYAIRLRSIAQKVATGDGVVVRRQEPGDQAKRGHFQSKYGGGKFLIQQMVRGNYQTLHSVTPPEAPTDGQDYSLEVGVVGKRLVSRLNSTSATTVMGDGFTRGKGFIDLSTPLHDIEVINLDGLPEAEALRLLGVDEKGNDLRGKSGAKSPDGVKSIPRLTRLTWTGPKLSAEMEAARKEGGRLRLWGTFKDSIPLPTTHQEFNSTDFVRVAGDGDVLFALTKSQRGVGMRLLDGKPKVYAKSGTDALTCGRRAAMLGAGRTALSFDEGAAHAFLGRPSAILAMKHSGAIFSMSAKAEVEWGVHRGIPSETPPSVESIPKNLVAAVGNAHGIAFLEDTGHVSYWNTRRGLDVRRMDELTDIVEIDGGENHLIALRADGRVVVVGIEAFSQPPANLPPAVAVRASIYGCAAQLADGTWIAWGPDAAVNEKVRGIGPAIDLELDHCRAGSKSKDAGYVAWIEPLPTAPKGGTVGGAGTDNPLAASIIAATKDAPFVNTLGMKFVPVPITGGPTDKQRVLFSVWETRVQDYEVFVKETKREWAMSKFEQGPTHPAVMVSWDDAAAFCVWLTERERKAGKLGANEHYRLPSDHEWSCAAGIGDKEDASTVPIQKSSKLIDRFSWGSTWPPVSAVENFSGLETDGHKTWEGQQIIAGYKDVFPTTAPVGSFAASPAGLFDTGGNVREWCLDDHDADKQTKVWRGASFRDSQRSALELSYRSGLLGSNRDEMYGFRVVLAPTKLDQP